MDLAGARGRRPHTGTRIHQREAGVTQITITPFVDLPPRVLDGARQHLETRYVRLLAGDYRLTVEP